MNTTSRNAGFTLVELSIAIVVMIPVLMAAMSTARFVWGDVNTNERAYDTTEALRKIERRVLEQLRPASLATIQVRVLDTDPWIVPIQVTEYPAIQFRCARSDNPAVFGLTGNREVFLRLDPKETRNGVDDDGDRLVDEASLVLQRAEMTGNVPLAANVESCTFSVNGAVLTIRFQIAHRDGSGRVHRGSSQVRIRIRND